MKVRNGSLAKNGHAPMNGHAPQNCVCTRIWAGMWLVMLGLAVRTRWAGVCVLGRACGEDRLTGPVVGLFAAAKSAACQRAACCEEKQKGLGEERGVEGARIEERGGNGRGEMEEEAGRGRGRGKRRKADAEEEEGGRRRDSSALSCAAVFMPTHGRRQAHRRTGGRDGEGTAAGQRQRAQERVEAPITLAAAIRFPIALKVPELECASIAA